ncbi:hypothetical protein PG996_004895 [Apiospora saccharicola]|uniref:Uncharacterized protein n=1 Tax=Apiospora saccharicola TaxID=335842 RepID=A0ABR1VK70_9PEZI
MFDNPNPQDMLWGSKPLGSKLIDRVLQKNQTSKTRNVKRMEPAPAPEVRPEDYLTIQNLVLMLKTVDLCTENGNNDVRGRQLEDMMRGWEESEKKFPLGCLEDAWYALQPREVGCRPRFMIRNDDRGTYAHVWHRPSVIRLGTIWTSSRPTAKEMIPPDPSGRELLSYWKKTPFKLVVEMKHPEENGDEIGTGSPTGTVWVVNDSGYHRESVDKRAKTELEKVLMARVADSLSDLVNCGRRERWPKFEKADADYLDYFPCYQMEKGGPILWKGAPDEECY